MSSENKKESYIHASCDSSDKAKWVKAAKLQNLKLTEWVNQVLNAEVKKK